MIQAAADAQIEQAAAGAGPRVLLVSDNRDNANWGSRATTMALLELMAAAGLSPSDRVLDAEVRSRVALADGPVAGRLLRQPALARLAVAGLARGGRTRLSLERLGVRDAVSDDPAETVRRWRRSGREPLAEWIARVERADAVVVNGEGSMIFTTPSRLEQRFHLAVMQLAHEADVPFAYVNALVADPANGPRNAATVAATRRLLPQARLVTTRDPWSQAFLREVAPEVASVYVPDSVFAWKGRVGRGRDLLARPEYLTPFHERPDRLGTWDFQRPYICVGGSSEAAKDPKRAAASYRRLLQALPELGYPLVVTVSSTGDAFLEELAHELGLPLVPADTNVMVATEILAHAELVVTGRYHPAILAGLGGVPGVLLGADSHKTASVQQMLGYPDIHVFAEQPTAADVSAILQRARRVLAERQRWQEAIETALALRAAEARRLTGHLESLGQVSA
ncbi:MAG TPA: polysaccharide pyruvyl transferase family protein [Trueperaceae bacterium]|nr:polysaccharide pyruvyl transferase family protein [Truepera sp.]HET9026472.1 polysaccharide pyruvyl transferase family protein [Trueperaceae bacterium]